MKVKVKVYGASISEKELKSEIKRVLEVRKAARELYELLSEDELNEIEKESKKRVSFRDFGDID